MPQYKNQYKELYRSQNDKDKPREECGVFAFFSTKRNDSAQIIYYGLQALQHRGQESAGIATLDSNKDTPTIIKNLGMVVDVFKKEQLLALSGNLGIGHVRYSTVGDNTVSSAQPISILTPNGHCMLAHNGTISNAHSLREFFEDSGYEFETNSDTEIILKLIYNKSKHGFPKAIGKTVSMLQGSYSLVVLVKDKIMGVKDPYGIRPLCIGKLAGEDASGDSYILASESCALDAVGAEYIREVEASEIVSIDKDGIHSYKYAENNVVSPCSFEHIYFARPDSIINGSSVYSTRLNSGKLLFEQMPIEADVVLGVPQSGLPSAIGYSEASGIPNEMGIIKNPYANRSFIIPTQEMRQKEISIKLNVVAEIVRDKRVIVIDDSLVRGNTSKRLIRMLRNNGAKEVHFMSASPPVLFPCYFGIDIAERKELAANNASLEELTKEIGADTLTFLSLENLKRAYENKPHCFACFTGTYPTYAPREGIE